MTTNIIHNSDTTKKILYKSFRVNKPSRCCQVKAVFGTGKLMCTQSELAVGLADLDKTSYITFLYSSQAKN